LSLNMGGLVPQSHVYYGFDGGLRDYDRIALTDTLIAGGPAVPTDPCLSHNVRFLKAFDGNIYLGTSGTSDDFTAGGQGIYSVTNIAGSTSNCSTSGTFQLATFTQLPMNPPITGGALDFAFANDGVHPTVLYVGFGFANPGQETTIHKYVFSGGQW